MNQPANMSWPMQQVALAMRDHPRGRTAPEVADDLRLNAGIVGRAMGHLRQLGMADVDRSARRGARTWTLTPRGRDLAYVLGRLLPAADGEARRAGSPLDALERSALAGLLELRGRTVADVAGQMRCSTALLQTLLRCPNPTVGDLLRLGTALALEVSVVARLGDVLIPLAYTEADRSRIRKALAKLAVEAGLGPDDGPVDVAMGPALSLRYCRGMVWREPPETYQEAQSPQMGGTAIAQLATAAGITVERVTHMEGASDPGVGGLTIYLRGLSVTGRPADLIVLWHGEDVAAVTEFGPLSGRWPTSSAVLR